MEYPIIHQFNFDFKHILIDEIALEGLEGIDVDLLWRRVEKRINSPITEKMKNRYWNFITSSPKISFYSLREPVPFLEIKDRFKIVDYDSGHLKNPDDYIDGHYEYCPVENEFGSCAEYKTRTLISNISSISYEEAVKKYNRKLVMVASREERFRALAPHVAPLHISALSPVLYCMLELIGRSRENGQMTIGTTNLLKIVKDAKVLFYQRKYLKSMDAIRVTQLTQKIGERGVKTLLMRLRRYHKSITMTLPTAGPIHDIVEILKTKPDYSEVLDNIFKQGLLIQHRNKKFQKTYSVFDFLEREVEVENKKKIKLPVKRKYIAISSKSDESSGSEEEPNEPKLKCQYKVGINLLRQAYLRLYDSGLKGVTQTELSQLLGIEFYTTRNICKMLKSKGLVKEVYEDKGRQRFARLVVVGSSINTVNAMYEEEWRKFTNYKNQIMTMADEIKKEKINTEQATTSLANMLMEQNIVKSDYDLRDLITEVKKIEGIVGNDLENCSLLSSKKSLTLRQLKYANGILKMVEENLAIAGYQGVNNLVSAEVGEPQMDTRALKAFLQKLMTDGLVKVFKIKWPDDSRYTVYICSMRVTSDHPIFKEKYSEILKKINVARQIRLTKQIAKGKGNRSLCRYAVPRYSKVRTFHEFIFKLVYGNDLKHETKLPEGFSYLIDVIPEMTVEFALGNVNLFGQINLSSSQVNEHLKKKLKDVPQEVSQEIVYAGTFRNTLRENLRILACFGLVQIINLPLAQHYDSIMFYVNRHAKIVNTAGTWPRADADLKELENEYYLGSSEDVTDFWNTVYQISLNTNISLEKRELNMMKPPVIMMNEAQNNDIGYRLGDGNGTCGFDSGFFLDVSRLWRMAVAKNRKGVKAMIKPVNIPKLQRKRKPRQMKNKRVLEREQCKERVKELHELKIPVSRGKKLTFSESWSKMEDLIIVLCRVAHTVMGPVSQAGSFRLKNMVARDILSANNPEKSQKLCHLRALALDSDSTWSYEKLRILNEFKKRRSLFKKYEGMLRKIRIRYLSNLSKYLSEARLPMMELVWILLQITKSEAYTQRLPCVATDYKNFHENFTICETYANKPYTSYHLPNAPDSEVVLKECIMLAVAMSYNRELPVNIAKKIYTIFKVFPEKTLRKAIEELRKSRAISAREKICNNKIFKMNLQDLVESSYKLSANYYRRWICKLNPEFLDSVAEALDLELPADDLKGSPGLNCYCCELHTAGFIELSTSTPPTLLGSSTSIQEDHLSVIDIEANFKLKSGTNLVTSKTDQNKFSLVTSNLDDHLKSVERNAAVLYPKKGNMEEEDDIVKFLKAKQEKGSIFSEIKEFTKWDSEKLIQRLLDLESTHIIKRVGFYDNRIVHIEYAKSWAMSLDRKTFLPAPWITLYGTLRHEIFFKWTNVIMSKIFENPGCSISYLTESCEVMTAKCVQDICTFLMQCECINMKVIRSANVDLFTEDDCLEEITNFNPYESPDNIFILPTNTVLTTYAMVRKKLVGSTVENKEVTVPIKKSKQ